MWPKRSEKMAPLTSLLSTKKKFVWCKAQQKAFDDIKKHVSKNTLLMYPDFNSPFEIHTNASDTQLGAIITQNKRPIAFYSKKLTECDYYQKGTVIGSTDATGVQNILLGQRLIVFTDHKNVTCTNFNTDRVYRWRLVRTPNHKGDWR